MAVVATNILITFNMLMNTELGLFEVIKNKYNDPDVFDNDILNLDDKILKGLLQLRPFRNPLMVIMKDKNESQADVFLKELIASEYENITKLSKPTTLVDVIKRFIDAESGFRVNILCATKLEASIISNAMGDYPPYSYKLIIESERAELDISQHDTIFLNYLDELLDFNTVMITGKNLMISDYYINLDPVQYEEKVKTVKDEYVVLFGSNSEFYTITLYHYDESYYLD